MVFSFENIPTEETLDCVIEVKISRSFQFDFGMDYDEP